MIFLHRFCIACRRLLPEDLESPVLSLAKFEIKWNNKKHKHVAKPVQEEEVYGLCETCAEKMGGLVTSQLEKGAKVL